MKRPIKEDKHEVTTEANQKLITEIRRTTMKRKLILMLLLLAIVSTTAFGSMVVISRWITCDQQHTEFLYPRINGAGIDRFYQIYPVLKTTTAYDTSAANHEWGDLAESTPKAIGATSAKGIDLYALGVTAFTVNVRATDIGLDTCVSLVRLSPDGVKWTVVDSVDHTADLGSTAKFYSADSANYARFMQVVIKTNDTHNAATVVRNKFDVTFNGFGPGVAPR